MVLRFQAYSQNHKYFLYITEWRCFSVRQPLLTPVTPQIHQLNKRKTAKTLWARILVNGSDHTAPTSQSFGFWRSCSPVPAPCTWRVSWCPPLPFTPVHWPDTNFPNARFFLRNDSIDWSVETKQKQTFVDFPRPGLWSLTTITWTSTWPLLYCDSGGRDQEDRGWKPAWAK
jgi:hypothetical protein